MQKRRTLGETIKAERKARGWTQKQLAERANVPPTTISNYENDNYEPTLFVAIGIAEAFGLSLDYLVGLTDKKAINR